MATSSGAKRVAAVVVVWGVILAIGVGAFFLVRPMFQRELIDSTSSSSQYEHEINFGHDNFSGYAIIRSNAMQKMMKDKGVKLDFIDDKGDYLKRAKALRDGKLDMAVFTLDAMVKSFHEIQESPATVVLVIDETSGADAAVAFKDQLGSIQDLDNNDARFVVTPNSPWEFMARTIIASFSLPDLPSNPFIAKDGSEKVYNYMMANGPAKPYAYVLGEPYLSRALEDDRIHVLMDSSKLKGMIVDVVVARRGFLVDKPELVQSFVENYLRTQYSYIKGDKMQTLVKEDDPSLSAQQAASIVSGISWKNTLENYGYFGVVPNASVPNLEDAIDNISDVLVATSSIPSDHFLAGQSSSLFYDNFMRDLHGSDFHPATKVSGIISGINNANNLDAVATASTRALSDSEWNRLIPAGQIKAENISFGRAKASIGIAGRRELERLAKVLNSMPQYYVVITGHARAEGDMEENMKLAHERAESVVSFLTRKGISKDRLMATYAKPSNNNGASQSVSFVVGQPPF